MSTTTLFVEILIIGLEALVWIGMALSIQWDFGTIVDFLKENKAYSALLSTFLLALAYILGIIVDRVADSFTVPLRYPLKAKPPAPFREMRLRIMHSSNGMAKFLDYQRSRLRIARATVLNLLMILLVAMFLITGQGDVGMRILPFVIAGGAVALVLSTYAARRIDKAQTESIIQAYEIITNDKEHKKMDPRIAAAVCYRRAEGGIEFLLVHTKGGKYWTFPKGHIKIKQAEAPWHAAGREAGEEAGVDGSIDREPFTHYTYYKGKGSREEMVAAFLMRVTSEREPDEPDRAPQWFTPEAAVQKLSEGRHEEKYIAEHKRVIHEALIRLGDTP